MTEEQLYKQAQDDLSRIGQVICEVNLESEKYQQELDGLKKELPDSLAAMTLGELTRAKVDEIKARIRLLEERVKETPLILQSLEGREGRCRHNCQVAYRRLERLYKSAKEELQKGDTSADLIESLKGYADLLGVTDDCERFLYELKKTK